MFNFTTEHLEAILVEKLKKAIDPSKKSDSYFNYDVIVLSCTDFR